MVALKLLEKGESLHKYALSNVSGCDRRTAQKVLDEIHAQRIGIRICRWIKYYGQHLPVYKIGAWSDAGMPLALMEKMRCGVSC